jgi:siroheme synthase
VAADAEAAAVRPPAVVVIGDVVGLRERLGAA